MKKNNKGFSLVELIIVIAIMAILAGAIAPALIRYIDKSRKSNDISAAKTIKTAVENAMANEKAYEELTCDGTAYLYASPKSSTITASSGATSGITTATSEILKDLSGSFPKINYKKAAATAKPEIWVIKIDTAGQIEVGLSATADTTTIDYVLAPEVCADYQ
jgi:type IV pilus assembly protein PilA